MALTVIERNRTGGTHSTRWDPIAERVSLRSDDGDHDGWELPDGTLILGPLRVPSVAKAAADATAAQAATALRTAKSDNETRLDELALAAAKIALKPSSVPDLAAGITALVSGLTANQRTAVVAFFKALAEYVARDRYHERAQDKANQ
jgi:hypothetical protein